MDEDGFTIQIMPLLSSKLRFAILEKLDLSIAWFAPAIVVGMAVPASIASIAMGLEAFEVYFTSLAVLSPFAMVFVAMAPAHVRQQHANWFWLALLALLGNIVWIAISVGAYFTTGGGPVWRLVDVARRSIL